VTRRVVETRSTLLAAAREHHRFGRPGEAAALYREILRTDPEDVAALQLLAVLAHGQGRGDEALTLFRRAIAIDPDCEAADMELGRLFEQRGDLEAAAICYRRAIRQHPADAGAHHALGRVLHRQGAIAEAVASYGLALQLMPDLAEAHSDLGEGLRRLGRIASALAACRQALALKPDLAEAHNNLGNVLQDQGRLGEAMMRYERALTLKPDLAEAHRNLANATWEWQHSTAAALAHHQAIARTAGAAAAGGDAPHGEAALALRKRDWLLTALERQRQLAPTAAQIERRAGLGAAEFLERYYAAARPVILVGEMAGWPALSLWTPDYLRHAVGAKLVEYQGDRARDPDFERQRDAHTRELPFDRFIDLITASEGNDAYMTVRNGERNAGVLSVLHKDLGSLDKFLSPEAEDRNGWFLIGPKGTFTPLHFDLTNNFLAQIVGRKRLKLVPPADLGLFYNHRGFLSDIPDLDDPASRTLDPLLAGTRVYDVVLEAGEIIFVPLGWWHQVKSLEFSVTVSYRNFQWPNDYADGYPYETAPLTK
jgi:tetratricopeptide (TPR) repeat protein